MTRILGLYATIALLIACLAGAALVYITESERAKRALERAQDYITGTEDARDATDDLPDDDSGLIDWLRDFAN